MSISEETLSKFVLAAADKLNGTWVIIGGAVLHLLNIATRQTEDIDLAGPETSTQAETLRLMELAESFGLPIEAINQAGAFFLHKIPGWEQKIIAVHRGQTATFFRPNLELYFELKIARLTEADAADCLSYLAYTVKNNEPANPEILLKLCEARRTAVEKRPSVDRLVTAIRAAWPKN
jgi:hypothetical protein